MALNIDYRNPYTIGIGLGAAFLLANLSGYIKILQSQFLYSSIVMLIVSLFCLGGNYVVDYEHQEQTLNHNLNIPTGEYGRKKKVLMMWWITLIFILILLIFSWSFLVAIFNPAPT